MLPICGIPLALRDFADQFRSVFGHEAQFGHFKEMLAGLLISENTTAAGIHQRLLDSDGYDSLRKFLSRSPWSVEELRKERLVWIKANLPQEKKAPQVISIDATFVHHTGENIYGVYWYWDYCKKAYVRAQRLVLSSWVSPSKQVPMTMQLYHRGYLEEQQLYLEAVKPELGATEEQWDAYNELVQTYEENCKNHEKQWQLAIKLVEEAEQLGIPKDAYVLDAGLITKELADKIEGYGQAWVSRLAKSRLVRVRGSMTESILSYAKWLPKEVFKAVQVQTRHGQPRTYWCFSKCIYVVGWQKLRVVISYDNESLDGEPIFLITNKTNWTQPQKIVQLYTYRDPIEHFIRDEKQEIGLEGCQQRSQQAVERYWELSFLAHTFLELGFKVTPPREMPAVRLETLGQKRRLMEREILQCLIDTVKQWVLEGRDSKELTDQIMLKRLNRLAC